MFNFINKVNFNYIYKKKKFFFIFINYYIGSDDLNKMSQKIEIGIDDKTIEVGNDTTIIIEGINNLINSLKSLNETKQSIETMNSLLKILNSPNKSQTLTENSADKKLTPTKRTTFTNLKSKKEEPIDESEDTKIIADSINEILQILKKKNQQIEDFKNNFQELKSFFGKPISKILKSLQKINDQNLKVENIDQKLDRIIEQINEILEFFNFNTTVSIEEKTDQNKKKQVIQTENLKQSLENITKFNNEITQLKTTIDEPLQAPFENIQNFITKFKDLSLIEQLTKIPDNIKTIKDSWVDSNHNKLKLVPILENLKIQLLNKTKELGEQKTNVAKLEKHIRDLSKQLKDSNDKNKTLKQKKKNLNQVLSAQKSKIEELEKELAEINDNLDEKINEREVNFKKEYNEKEQSLKSVQRNEIAKYEEEIQQNKKKIQSLETSLNITQKELKTIKQIKDQQDKELQDLKNELITVQRQRQDAIDNNRILSDQLKIQGDSIQQKEQEIKELNINLAKSLTLSLHAPTEDQKIIQLRSENENYKYTITKLEAQLKSDKQTITILEQQSKQLKLELEQTQYNQNTQFENQKPLDEKTTTNNESVNQQLNNQYDEQVITKNEPQQNSLFTYGTILFLTHLISILLIVNNKKLYEKIKNINDKLLQKIDKIFNKSKKLEKID